MRANKTKLFLLTPLLAGLLFVGGCGRDASDRTVGEKVDAATSKMADKASSAANTVATATEDSAITAKVKAAIVAEPGLKSLDINVDTKDATVTLSGTVASADLRDRAKQVASSTSGVKGVVDNLTVKV
jgi:osmotically-inducible protein OsmY